MRDDPRFRRRAWAALTTLLLSAGCAATRPASLPPTIQPQRLGSAQQPTSWPAISPTVRAAADAARRESLLRDRAPEFRNEFDFRHPRVDDFVESFQTHLRAYFERALARSARHVPGMTAILEQEGVPAELAYLPLIESGFRTGAVSRAGAVGPWQFIRDTGRRYGLRIDGYVDERRDPEKSTRAAAQYLRDLHRLFGCWHLSLAAYNTGEERIARIIDQRGVESFWDMMERGYLHRETSNFVPQFLAALQIARAPEAHGFDQPAAQPLRYDLVRVGRSLPLRTVAKMAGVPLTEIAELNPQLVRSVTPPDRSGYGVRVPKGSKAQFTVAYATMLREARHAQARRASAGTAPVAYRIRRGDTPSAIARRFGVSVRTLMKANGWKDPRRLQPGQPVRIPVPARTSPVRLAARRPAPPKRLN